MDKDDFYAAKEVEADGWEFLYISDAGEMVFNRYIATVEYVAHISKAG